MFNLEDAINRWCEQVGATRGRNPDLLDELKDHLNCEIEALLDTGLDEEQAFNQAIQKMGDTNELLKEYSENRRLYSVLCAAQQPRLSDYAQNRDRVMNYRKNAKRIIGQSLLWATAILVSALLLGDAENYATYMLLLVVLATVSINLDPGMKETARVEAAFFRRLLGK